MCLTDLMSKPKTLAMYAGIFVSRVQNPQLCAEWTIINEINGSDVNIASQGVGGLVVVVISFAVDSAADSINDRSSAEIFLYSEGELLPNMNQNIAHMPPATPEK